MALNSILVTFAVHLVCLSGALLPVSAVSVVNAAAGMPVVLHCLNATKEKQSQNKVVWKYAATIIIQYTQQKIFKVDKSATYKFGDPENGNFSLVLPDAVEGHYICEVEGKPPITYDLKVWKVTGAPSGYLLQGETLSMELLSSDMNHISTEWFGPHNAKVTGKEPRWKLTSNNLKLQIKDLTVQKDHGTWKCHILPDGPYIPYDVKVIGFLNGSDDNMTFAAVNSSVVLSCPLNIDVQKEGNTPKVQVLKWMKNNKTLVEKHISVNANGSLPAVKVIPMVQFEDAGRYQCHLRFARGYLKKTIHLVVMKVSVNPLDLSSKEANVTLCCHIPAPVPPVAELCWVNGNETKCDSRLPESKLCYVTRTVGLWRCDLKLNNNVKISINYTVGTFQRRQLSETTLQNKFPQIEVASVAVVMLLLFIIAGVSVPTCKRIKRKRQIAKRMTQAKHHLLAKRTCQCQRELTNDYYHA